VVAALSGVVIMPDLQNQSTSQRTKLLIEKLLLGRFTLAEIAKITGISEQWLQTYVNARAIFEPH
jgi:phage repressor protein C with HTH and peptisase S24 domain